MRIIEHFRTDMFIRQWLKKNKHNQTVPVNRFPIEAVEVGKESYGKLYIQAFSDKYCLKIGHYCSIGHDVTFILSAEHSLNHLSTYPFLVKIMGKKNEATSKGDIIIEDDVWIGYGATILSGVRIGRGAVVAAGAIVHSNVPPYAIVAGIPAKIVKFRFEKAIIKELMRMDFGKLSRDLIKKNIHSLYHDIDSPISAREIVNILMDDTQE